MAKGKHSVALFEVIQSSRTTRGEQSLRTPKWWFKRRNRDGSAPSPAAGQAAPPIEPESTAPAPRTAGVDLKVDPDRQRINFNMSYSSAIVAAFTVIVVVGLSYIIGQRMQHGPAPAMAGPTSEQVRQGPVNSNVLNVATTPPKKTPPPAEPSKPPVMTSTPIAAAAPAPLPAAPATTAPSGQRIMGLNYVIVQGYPAEEKTMAFEACELLKKNGVPCSVETGVPGYKPDWHVVIGLTGFERPKSDTTYPSYEKRINDLSDKFASDRSSGNAKFKRFAPFVRKWTGLNEH